MKKRTSTAIIEKIINTIEVYIPLVTFSILFIVFILQVFFRYVLDKPLVWPYETTIFAFIWTTLLAAAYVRHRGEHVEFGLVYSKLSERGRLIFNIAGNFLVLIAFTVPFPSVVSYFIFIHIEKSPVLRIPFSIAFSPFLVFMILVIIYSLSDLIRDIKKLMNGDFKK
jgi:TRAP-type C4-dicarboxylate transport system permease small subunit